MKARKPPQDTGACGTYQGYERHRWRGERPCLPCDNARNIRRQDKRYAAQRRAVLAEAVGDGSYGGIAGGS